MPRRTFDRIKTAIRAGGYDLTVHASEEMAEDELGILDVETSILHGEIAKSEKGDLRGTRYTIYGTGTDRAIRIGTVGRFTETDRYLIITVYKVTEA